MFVMKIAKKNSLLSKQVENPKNKSILDNPNHKALQLICMSRCSSISKYIYYLDCKIIMLKVEKQALFSSS